MDLGDVSYLRESYEDLLYINYQSTIYHDGWIIFGWSTFDLFVLAIHDIVCCLQKKLYNYKCVCIMKTMNFGQTICMWNRFVCSPVVWVTTHLIPPRLSSISSLYSAEVIVFFYIMSQQQNGVSDEDRIGGWPSDHYLHLVVISSSYLSHHLFQNYLLKYYFRLLKWSYSILFCCVYLILYFFLYFWLATSSKWCRSFHVCHFAIDQLSWWWRNIELCY